MQYDSGNLIVRSGTREDTGVIVDVAPEMAGWDYIHFQVRKLAGGSSWSHATGEHELAIVMLGGTVAVESPQMTWEQVGGRENVFAGLPHALYLPRRTAFTIRATTDCEFALAWVRTEEDHPARLITPADVKVEIRGGDNATRQINGIIPPGFDCHRLVLVEVYTPSGGWSSYPPHKHDVHREDEAGRIVEADLEEVYYYKFDKPHGYAYQRVYTDDSSPLQQAGSPIDAVLMPRENDVVLVPEGYHPVVCPPGYNGYYLNVLAGSAQSLSAVDDPDHGWVKESYTSTNPAVPVYPV